MAHMSIDMDWNAENFIGANQTHSKINLLKIMKVYCVRLLFYSCLFQSTSITV